MTQATSLCDALRQWVTATCPLFTSTLINHFQWPAQLSSDISNLVASKMILEPIDISLSKHKDCKSVYYYSPAFMSIASECFQSLIANIQDITLPSLSIFNNLPTMEVPPLTVNILINLLKLDDETFQALHRKAVTRPLLAEFLACLFSACLNTFIETTPVFHLYLPFRPESSYDDQLRLNTHPYIRCSSSEIEAMFSNKGYLNIAFIAKADQVEVSLNSSITTLPKLSFIRLMSSLHSVDLASYNYFKQLKNFAKNDSASNRQRSTPNTYSIIRNRRDLLLSLENIFASTIPALGSIVPLPWQELDVAGKPSCPEVCVRFFLENAEQNHVNISSANSASFNIDSPSALTILPSASVSSPTPFSTNPSVLGPKNDSDMSRFCSLERFERSIETTLASSSGSGISSSGFTPLSIPFLAFSPVAFFRSCFREKFGTPRQGSFCAHSRGELVLRSDIDSDAFDGLENFSHVWVVFVFHANNPEYPLMEEDMRHGFQDAKKAVKRCHNEIEGDNHSVSQVRIINATERTSSFSGSGYAPISGQTKVRAKVRPPKMGGGKTGFFASRSPHRFNPIGLTVAKVRRVQGNKLLLSGCDLIDGTPVLDIKPYHPADSIPLGHLVVPPWVMDGFEKNKDPSMYPTQAALLENYCETNEKNNEKPVFIPIPIVDLNPVDREIRPKEQSPIVKETETETEKEVSQYLELGPGSEACAGDDPLKRHKTQQIPTAFPDSGVLKNHNQSSVANIAGNTARDGMTTTSSTITISMSSDVFLYLNSLFLSDGGKAERYQEKKRKNAHLHHQPIFDFFHPDQKDTVQPKFNKREKVGADLLALPSVLLPCRSSDLPASLSLAFVDFLECVGEVQRADPRSLYSRKHHSYGSIFGIVIDSIQLTYVLMNPTSENKSDDGERLHLHLFHAQLNNSKHTSIGRCEKGCEKPVFVSSLGFKNNQPGMGFVSEEIRSSAWVNAVKAMYPHITYLHTSANNEQVIQRDK